MKNFISAVCLASLFTCAFLQASLSERILKDPKVNDIVDTYNREMSRRGFDFHGFMLNPQTKDYSILYTDSRGSIFSIDAKLKPDEKFLR